ncbi:MAG: type IV pilus assembly protein PilM [Gaiellaceae bacterium]
MDWKDVDPMPEHDLNAPAPEPEAQKQSIWKKEISFRRAPKPAVTEPQAEVAADAPDAAVVPEAELAPAGEIEPAATVELELAALAAPEPELEPAAPEPAGPVVEVDSEPAPAAQLLEPVAAAGRPGLIARLAAARRRTPKQKAPARASAKRSGKHRSKKIVGLKIGGSQLAAASISNNGSAALLQVAREPLESGVVVSGEVRDADALAASLKAFFKKHKLPRREIRLGVSNNRIGVRIFEISGVDDPAQLANAVRFRAQEVLPIPLEEAVLDYHVLEERVGEDGTLVRRVLLAVAYRDFVDLYVQACRKAGLKLIGIDLEAFALLRALAIGADLQADSGMVVVSAGHDRSTLAVSNGAACDFTRVLDWGGFSISLAISRALEVSTAEADAIKRQLSLVDASLVPEGLSAGEAAAALLAARREVESFARELVSSLRFYQNQPGSLSIGEIVLTGGSSSLRGLDAELERLVGVRVRVGDPLAGVKVAKKVDPAGAESLAVAIGLGIEV